MYASPLSPPAPRNYAPDSKAQRGGSRHGSQQFATCCCKPRFPYSTPLPGTALLTGYHLLTRHLLPDVTWSTLTTLGSDYLTITISLSSHALPSPRKSHSFTNFSKADWVGRIYSRDREDICDTLLPTSCSAGEKVSATL